VLPQNAAERATPPQLAAGRSPRLRVNDLGGGLRSGESRFRLGLERWVALRKRSQRLPSARLPVPALRTRSARSFRDYAARHLGRVGGISRLPGGCALAVVAY